MAVMVMVMVWPLRAHGALRRRSPNERGAPAAGLRMRKRASERAMGREGRGRAESVGGHDRQPTKTLERHRRRLTTRKARAGTGASSASIRATARAVSILAVAVPGVVMVVVVGPVMPQAPRRAVVVLLLPACLPAAGPRDNDHTEQILLLCVHIYVQGMVKARTKAHVCVC